MRLLLDTHALLWWLDLDPRLSAAASGAIADEDNLILVSAASAYEIANKHRLGKLPQAEPLVGAFDDRMQAERFQLLPLTSRHAVAAGVLAGDHRDPFDRMLIAQAVIEGATLVSNEALFDRFGVRRLW